MNNKNQNDNQPSLPRSFIERLLSSQWMERLIEQKRIVLSAAAAVVAVLVIIAFAAHFWQKKSNDQYKLALTYAEQLKNMKTSPDTLQKRKKSVETSLLALKALADKSSRIE